MQTERNNPEALGKTNPGKKQFAIQTVLAFCLCLTSVVLAQPKQIVAVNPVFLPFGTATAEYERVVAPKITIGISGWYEYKDVKARWAYLKVMFYPGGEALSGFGAGVTMGILRAYRGDDETDLMAQDTTPIAGLMVQYNWPLGSRDQYLVGIGMGGRVALKNFAENSPLNRFDGDVRLVTGMRF